MKKTANKPRKTLPGAGFYVYALFCDFGPSERGFVKIGISRRLRERISSIRSSCPVPAKYVGFVEAGTKAKMIELEISLHEEFASRNLHGEWFEFDFLSETDKKEFSEGCGEAFLGILGNRASWNIISIADIDEQSRLDRLALRGKQAKEQPKSRQPSARLMNQLRDLAKTTELRHLYNQHALENSGFWKPN